MTSGSQIDARTLRVQSAIERAIRARRELADAFDALLDDQDFAAQVSLLSESGSRCSQAICDILKRAEELGLPVRKPTGPGCL